MSKPEWRRQMHRSENPRGTLRLRDFGDCVHLWFEQRVSWPVALEILKELKAPGLADETTARQRRDHPKHRIPRTARERLKRSGPHNDEDPARASSL
jgi:hypothetical protein